VKNHSKIEEQSAYLLLQCLEEAWQYLVQQMYSTNR